MKQFLQKNKGVILVCAAVLLFAGGWLALWDRIGSSLDEAGYAASFDTVTFAGAYYTVCSDAVLAEYIGESAENGIRSEWIGAAFDADAAVDTPAGTVHCKAYHCKPLTDAGKRDGIIFLDRSGTLYAYELMDFISLGDAPSIAEVCAAYGIGSAADIAAVDVCDADGTLLDSITDADAAAQFYTKFTALGDALTKEETAAHYVAAYEAEYGKSDDVTVKDGAVSTANDAVYQQAMTLWSTGLCLVQIRLQNGLQIRNTVYSPGAGLYTVRAVYALETPFFS